MTPLFRKFRRWLVTAANEALHGLPMLVVAPVMVDTDLLVTVLTIVLLVISLGIHEAAHAWVAWKCGDSTAKDLGRITLNPVAHIDPVRTILMPTLLYISTGHAFGGAKPVPVNFHRLHHPWRDMSLVAFAGPLSNFLQAIFFLAAWHFFVVTGLYNHAAASESARTTDLLPIVLQTAFAMNVTLAVFNLVPIPPLDGSRILAWVLPTSIRSAYTAIEPWGLFIVFFLLYQSEEFRHALNTVENDIGSALMGLVTLGGRW